MQEASLRLTGRGVAALWLALILALVGVFRIDGVLVLLALTLVVVVLAARVWARRNVHAISIGRRLPAAAFAGTIIEVPFRVENQRSHLEARAITVRGDGTVASGACLTPEVIAAGELAELSGRLRVPPRGRHAGGEWDLRSSFPGGLFEARRHESFGDEWLVYPAPVLPPNLERVMERARMERLLRWRLEHEVSGEFRGIRDYQVGDPMKSIHWPASARSGTLMARQWDPPAPRAGRVGIVVHSLTPTKRMFRSGLFEAALRAASGVVRFCQQEAVRVSFAAGFDDWRLRKAPDAGCFSEIFEKLALARRHREMAVDGLRKVIRQMSKNCERIIVIGDAPLEDWRPRVEAIGAAGVELVCVSGEAVAVRRPGLKLRSVPQLPAVKALAAEPKARAETATKSSGESS